MNERIIHLSILDEQALLEYWQNRFEIPQELSVEDDDGDYGGLPEINNHYFKYTDRVCEECGGQVVYDPHHDEYYCLVCGLVQE